MSKNCKNCGTPMPEEAEFCLFCLTKQSTNISDNVKEKSFGIVLLKSFFKENKKRVIIVTLALIIIILLILLSAFLGNKSDTVQLGTRINPWKQSNIVSTIVDNGSIITTYEDGTVETKEEDGTVITKQSDGTVVTKKSDGTVITENTDGTVITENTDGTVITENTDGTVVTSKPDGTIITESPDGTTTVSTTPTTSSSTQTTSPTTSPTVDSSNTTTSTTNNVSDSETSTDNANFEFGYNSRNQLCITKYTGNAKVVTVPTSYNGEDIYEISEKTFENNSNVEKIIFESASNYAPVVKSYAVYNCPNLKEVVFNWNDLYKKNSQYADTTISANFATLCTSLNNIVVNGSSYYKFSEYGLYYLNNDKKTYTLFYYCEGANTSEYYQPSWCTNVVTSAFKSNKKIKKIYINPQKNTISNYLSSYLEAVYIDDDNQYYFDDEGVVYDKVSNSLQCYPFQKSNKTYAIKDGYYVYFHLINNNCNEVNKYLETLYIPNNVNFCQECLKSYCTKSNLKTIYIEKDNKNIDYIKENFKGTVIIY